MTNRARSTPPRPRPPQHQHHNTTAARPAPHTGHPAAHPSGSDWRRPARSHQRMDDARPKPYGRRSTDERPRHLRRYPQPRHRALHTAPRPRCSRSTPRRRGQTRRATKLARSNYTNPRRPYRGRLQLADRAPAANPPPMVRRGQPGGIESRTYLQGKQSGELRRRTRGE